MNYRPNERVWRRGDLVLHDADAKRDSMLMRVIGFAGGGKVRTRYLHPERPRTVYANRNEVLHDPARFGVVVPEEWQIPREPGRDEAEIARLRGRLRQIAAAVGDEGGRCIDCELVRTMARVALEGA